MDKNLSDFKKNGYLICKSLPDSALLELKKTLVSLIKKIIFKKYRQDRHSSR
jgi:hypothetical protein